MSFYFSIGPAAALLTLLIGVGSIVGLAIQGEGSTPEQVQASPPKDTPLSTVEALHAAFGRHHARALHTKGVILEGTFTPAPEARSIVKTPIFSGGPLPIIARFSF